MYAYRIWFKLPPPYLSLNKELIWTFNIDRLIKQSWRDVVKSRCMRLSEVWEALLPGIPGEMDQRRLKNGGSKQEALNLWEGSAGGGACCQAWWPELTPGNPGERTVDSHTFSSDLHAHIMCTSAHSINKTSNWETHILSLNALNGYSRT